MYSIGYLGNNPGYIFDYSKSNNRRMKINQSVDYFSKMFMNYNQKHNRNGQNYLQNSLLSSANMILSTRSTNTNSSNDANKTAIYKKLPNLMIQQKNILEEETKNFYDTNSLKTSINPKAHKTQIEIHKKYGSKNNINLFDKDNIYLNDSRDEEFNKSIESNKYLNTDNNSISISAKMIMDKSENSEKKNCPNNNIKYLNCPKNNKALIVYLKIIQFHLDFENLINNNTKSIDNISELVDKFKEYFANIKQINFLDNVFNDDNLKLIFYNLLKIQLIFNTCFYFIFIQIHINDYYILIYPFFKKVIRALSHPLYNLYFYFINKEILEHQELADKKLNNFSIYYTDYQLDNKLSIDELYENINNNITKCIHSLKYFFDVNLKLLNITGLTDILVKLLNVINDKALSFFIESINNVVLYDINYNFENPEELILVKRNKKNKINIDTISEPYLPEINKEKYKYTLVLDLDETLIHNFLFNRKNHYYLIRPYCLEFLNQLKSIYEIILFTSGTQIYADEILNKLDKNGDIFQYRLYRQHTTINKDNSTIKDLSKLGRNLNRIIIIDNLEENFQNQPDNGLSCNTWTNDINDTELKDLLKILKDIHFYKLKDVRVIIKKIKSIIAKNISSGKSRYTDINIAEIFSDE